jgi:hypothetical protein
MSFGGVTRRKLDEDQREEGVYGEQEYASSTPVNNSQRKSDSERRTHDFI